MMEPKADPRPDEAEEDDTGDVMDWSTTEVITAQVIDEMAAWIEEDIQSNKNDKPALKKLAYSPKLLKSLKNFNVQESFINYGGWKYLSAWLAKLPDGSFPSLNVIETGLEIWDFLPIEDHHLTETSLGKSVSKISKMKFGNGALKRKAAELISKWKRQMASRYNTGVSKEEQYINFKKKKQIEAEVYQRKNDKRFKTQEGDEGEYDNEGEFNNEEEENKEKPKKQKKKSEGFFIPQKNQFDFTYKPESQARKTDRKIKPDSIQGQFIRATLKMKKQYTSQQKASFAAIKPNLDPDKN